MPSTQIPTEPDTLIEGDLDLSGRDDLITLPENLTVGGSLNISDCNNITELPVGLTVYGTLDSSRCRMLLRTQENLRVVGSFICDDCPNFSLIHRTINIGDASFKNCPSIRVLSNTPFEHPFGGALDFNFCVNLTTLPQNLHVEGRLVLIGCSRITRLPRNLHVGGDLFLRGTMIENLDNLNENSVSGSIYGTRGSPPLSAEQILHFTDRTGINVVGMSDSIENESGGYLADSDEEDELSRPALGGTRDGGRGAMGLSNSRPATPPPYTAFDIFKSLFPPGLFTREQLDNMGYNSMGSKFEDSELNRNQYLIQFIGTISNMNDYNNYMEYTIRRLVAVLNALFEAGKNGNSELEDSILGQMMESSTSCGDRTVLGLDKIEEIIEIDRIEKAEGKNFSLVQIKNIGKGIFLKEKVAEQARIIARAKGQSYEEISYILALQLALKKYFDLPIKTHGMSFRSLANLTPQEIESVKDNIRIQLESDGEREFNEWLETFKPYQILRRKKLFPPYESIDSTVNVGASDEFFDFFSQDNFTMENAAENDIEQPVEYTYPKQSQRFGFSYEALKVWYVNMGTDPYERKPFDFKRLKRIVVVARKRD